ncbi:glycoside hydrolase 43 family protein [Salipaludibacillus neizhouensis]|uniref:Glycoside hydrolase 43 family protein n=1 Tax=Salipaludibacillus neizhouensis TaxID=885475 RepID=A0A3A9KD72_9BACI|nr:glycoside hydrolase family 43 protein [Salipaludibacillus neizhouensis]RKL68461.1 glycoside hydrolase 43 family protein [Salipaludibacillus neizhouensis]
MKIENPILKGFHPDPSIVRVGEDYFIVTSTFEWWPGVRLHRSKDLKNWEILPYPLNRKSQLDLTGVGDSQGIWAPCLTYDNGIFYLVYTVVTSFYCNMQDTKNFLVMAESVEGTWSEPIALNNFGFDPSLFHDTDGRKYIISMVTDHRVPQKYGGRLLLQEYDPKQQKMVGELKDIYQGEHGYLEGPHIYRRGEFYYLFAAERGTGEEHGQVILRSQSIWGPYESYENNNSILTSRNNPEHNIQKAGHADLVQAADGDWYMVHLCGRPLNVKNPDNHKKLPAKRRYTLGRETALQKVYWTEDGWLRLSNGTSLPEVVVELDNKEQPIERKSTIDDFDKTELDLEFQSLRNPLTEENYSLTERPGYLRLYGRDGLSSRFNQSLIARRWTEFEFEAETKIEFIPKNFKQMAGLVCLYDVENFYYLHVTFDEDLGRCISIIKSENRKIEYPIKFIPVRGNEIYLKVIVDHHKLQFLYSIDRQRYKKVGPEMDASILSDEACDQGWFKGAMVGICCQDMAGSAIEADFDWFKYQVPFHK